MPTDAAESQSSYMEGRALEQESVSNASGSWDDFFDRYTCVVEPDVRLKFRKRCAWRCESASLNFEGLLLFPRGRCISEHALRLQLKGPSHWSRPDRREPQTAAAGQSKLGADGNTAILLAKERICSGHILHRLDYWLRCGRSGVTNVFIAGC